MFLLASGPQEAVSDPVTHRSPEQGEPSTSAAQDISTDAVPTQYARHPEPAGDTASRAGAQAGAQAGAEQAAARAGAAEDPPESAGVQDPQHRGWHGDLPDKPGHLDTAAQCRLANAGVCWHLLQMAVRARQITQKSDDAQVRYMAERPCRTGCAA